MLKKQEKIMKLCHEQKISILNEITRSMSGNQLEYIMVDKDLIENCFVTSYNNFISDHKSIIARIGSSGNELMDDIKERIMFDRDSHLKARHTPEDQFKTPPSHNNRKEASTAYDQRHVNPSFNRRFKNPDMATCWLNSCLQLILTAMDYDEYSTSTYSSELGKELIHIQSESKIRSVDPSVVKDIIMATEDTRIATRLSDLSYRIFDKNQLNIQSHQITNLRLDLGKGQQCVRDFFLCLNENLISWPDVYSTLSFDLSHSSECTTCKHKNISNTTQLYLELPVPPTNSDLKDYVEEFLNEGSMFGVHCQDGCKSFTQKMKWTSITKVEDVKFLTVILTRGIETLDGYELIRNKIKSSNNVLIR